MDGGRAEGCDPGRNTRFHTGLTVSICPLTLWTLIKMLSSRDSELELLALLWAFLGETRNAHRL